MSGQGCDDLNDVHKGSSFVVVDKMPEICCENEFTRKKNIYFKGLGGCLVLKRLHHF